jgi:protein SSD1
VRTFSNVYLLSLGRESIYPCFVSHTHCLCRIPEREFDVRRDLRQERIFTIDPESARDLDDAVSVKLNDDGTYDIGVHIADVSYFVKPNTALDRDAKKRATSVYLVQRAVPMLPPTLSEELCSLVPGKERLAFSVIFTMTKDARVTKKWFGRTVIK